MSLKNNSTSFGLIAKLFHWIVGLGILTMLGLGISLGYVSKSHFKTVMFVHKSLGITILLLMILRLIWRWISPVPGYPNTMSTFDKFIAHTMAWSLYILVFAIIFAGILATAYHGYTIPVWHLFTIHLPIAANKSMSHFYGSAHTVLAWVISACICLHILASLYHHYIRKDNILKRMTSN